MPESFDYIIVGAGSSGCVLAARLTENPNTTVCLIEAGGSDQSVVVQAPFGLAAMMPTKINNWAFETVPQPGLNGRKGYQPRGKTLGGSSSTNAMLYVRGNAWDYDNWAALGNRGWSYKEVLPYFKKSEGNEVFNDAYHSNQGPLGVSDPNCESTLNELFLQCCEEQGLSRNRDYNGKDQEGVFLYQRTIKNGERCSAAKAFLTPNLSRPNLKVITKALTQRILFNGKKAIGIRYYTNGQLIDIHCKREVLISAGAFGSPQILMLSGIGSAEQLKLHGIGIIHHLAGVGENLQDHIDYVQTFKVPTRFDTFGISIRGCWRILLAMFEWQRKRTGIISSSIAESGGFFSTRTGLPAPDMQLLFAPGIIDNHARKLHPGHGYSCHLTLMRPKSRGNVKLRSANPTDSLLIDPKFFSDPQDMADLMAGAKKMQAILEGKALSNARRGMLYPVEKGNDNQLENDIRNRADTQYHPVGTCKMAPQSDPNAVVDEQLRVYGVEALRVVDASIMPDLISGNTNAAAIMIGEKAADIITRGKSG